MMTTKTTEWVLDKHVFAFPADCESTHWGWRQSYRDDSPQHDDGGDIAQETEQPNTGYAQALAEELDLGDDLERNIQNRLPCCSG